MVPYGVSSKLLGPWGSLHPSTPWPCCGIQDIHQAGQPPLPLALTSACCTYLLASGAQTVGQVQQTTNLGVWMLALQVAWALC